MKILLTGATGGLGFRTLERLIENPKVEKIIATGRVIRPTHFVENSKVNYQLGNLEDADFVSQLVEQADYIVHAAALSSPWGKYAEFEKANVFTMKNLINAAKKHHIKRFVYVSTPSLYFNGQDRFDVKESDPLPTAFVNAYSKTKYEAEVALEKSGIPYVTLRPRALIGRGDTIIMPRLIRAFEEGKLKIIGDGKNIVDLTSLANVADSIELSLFVGDTGLYQIYNITNGEPVKLWETIEKVLSMLGHEMNKKKVPYSVVKFISQIMELKAKLTNYKEPALTTYGAGILAKSFTMDISKAKTFLGYSPKVSTDEAIDEFVSWYLVES
ncbi:3-beta hydroxysteroid dehydrogenase [Emticicia aquatilis]|uniref:3-beta hydroxysteroid dehydrogenase n=1 Tax=Emticicia aquatilis TaxID=1537369 RepID=A0A916YVJ4_9BACT|nr:NAD-dependent epimerase/dehydratase family protein [Emticicia aquatilis]GGD62901.1 3-beta hydroxysteroid dehydrogenase [Emticicia aquatilis]